LGGNFIVRPSSQIKEIKYNKEQNCLLINTKDNSIFSYGNEVKIFNDNISNSYTGTISKISNNEIRVDFGDYIPLTEDFSAYINGTLLDMGKIGSCCITLNSENNNLLGSS
jgi:hypothetical protein